MLTEVVILVGPVLAVAILVSLLVNIVQVAHFSAGSNVVFRAAFICDGVRHCSCSCRGMWRHLANYTIHMLSDFRSVLQ